MDDDIDWDARLSFARRIFRGADDALLTGIARRVTRRRYEAGTEISSEGPCERAATCSESGELETGGVRDGKWKSFAVWGPGEVSNVNALYFEYDNASIVRANTDASFLVLTAEAVREELAENGALALHAIDFLALQLKHMTRSVEKLQATARARR